MNHTRFNWDKYFAHASFKEVRESSPELNERRFPSGFSPDKRLYYVSPLDLVVETNDSKSLKAFLRMLGQEFHSAEIEDFQRRYLVYTDFVQICLLLLDLEGEDSRYGLPDKVLAEKNFDH